MEIELISLKEKNNQLFDSSNNLTLELDQAIIKFENS